MNKLYFAKYLPVEGEIQEGDSFITPSGAICNEYKLAIKGIHKKFKFFLCSRDIRVGDKVKFQLVPNKTPWVDGEVIWQEADTTEIKLDTETTVITTPDHFCFKVMGEISPKATWVKEGDEFDEYKEDITLFKGGSKKLIQVKGSCGHFH